MVEVFSVVCFFTSGECLRQFWLSRSVLCILLARVLGQSTGDDDEQQEQGHETLLHGCSWNRWDKARVVAVPPSSVLAARHAAVRTGQQSSRHNYAAGRVGAAGAAPGRAGGHGRVRFAQHSALKDPAASHPSRMCMSVLASFFFLHILHMIRKITELQQFPKSLQVLISSQIYPDLPVLE